MDRKPPPPPPRPSTNPKHDLRQAFLHVADSLYPHLKCIIHDMVKQSIHDVMTHQKQSNPLQTQQSKDGCSQLTACSGRRKQPKRAVNLPPPVSDFHQLPWETLGNDDNSSQTNNLKLPWEGTNDDDHGYDFNPFSDTPAWMANTPPSKRAKRSNCEEDLPLFSLDLDLDIDYSSDPSPTSVRPRRTTPTWVVASPKQADPLWTAHRDNRTLCLVIETELVVHIIEYNDKGQMYIIKQLTTLPHYQKQVSDCANTPFLDTKFKDKNVTVQFYPNNSDHANDFLFIVNQKPEGTNAELKEIVEAMDFSQVSDMLVNPSKSNLTSTDRNENCTNITFGYTSQKYVDNEQGLQIIDIANNTIQVFITNLFRCAAKVLTWESVPEQFRYRPANDRYYYLRRITNEKEGNEGEPPSIVHEALTMSTGLLKEHTDSHNPSPEHGNIANVMGISCYVAGQRYNVGFFNKHSVSCSIQRVNYFTRMCNEFETFYRNLPPCRLPIHIDENGRSGAGTLINDSLAKKIPYPSPGMESGMPQYFSLPCNVCPTGYHTLFLDSFIWLKCNMDLTFTDLAGMVSVCFEQQPNTALFLSMAVDCINPPPEGRKPMGDSVVSKVVRYVSSAMSNRKAHFDKYYKEVKKEPMGIYRYSARNNSKSRVVSNNEIYSIKSLRAATCLYVWQVYPVSPSRKQLPIVYDSIMKLFEVMKTPKTGGLALQHEMGLMSYLGLLPDWVRLFANVDGRLQNQLKSVFPSTASTTLNVWCSKNGQRSAVDSIARNLAYRNCGNHWSSAKVENFLCKFIRSRGRGDDSGYVDVHQHGEIAFEEQFVTVTRDGESKEMHYLSVATSGGHYQDDGMSRVCETGVLFDKWVFQGKIKSAAEVSWQLPKFKTTPKKLISRSALRLPTQGELMKLFKDGKLDVVLDGFASGRDRVQQSMHDPYMSWPQVVHRRTES